MSDYYTLLAYIQNADKDILADLNNVIKTDKEIESGEITDMIITDDPDEFVEGKKNQNVVENFKDPKKNKRRINIPDAEIKEFHNRYNEDFEEYYEPRELERYPDETRTEEEYYTNPENQTSSKNKQNPSRTTRNSSTTSIKKTPKQIAKKDN